MYEIFLIRIKTPHSIFTIMNHQRISTFYFCSPVLPGIHRNPNWKEFLKSCESFLRKSQFSTLTYLNPGFGGPWDMLEIFFVNVIFITLQKKSFGQKKFWIPCAFSKVPFCQNWKIAKMALLNPCMKFKFFLAERLLWSDMKMTCTKNISNMSQGLPNPGFR